MISGSGLLILLVSVNARRRWVVALARRVTLRIFAYLVRNQHLATFRYSVAINRVVELGQLVEFR